MGGTGARGAPPGRLALCLVVGLFAGYMYSSHRVVTLPDADAAVVPAVAAPAPPVTTQMSEPSQIPARDVEKALGTVGVTANGIAPEPTAQVGSESEAVASEATGASAAAPASRKESRGEEARLWERATPWPLTELPATASVVVDPRPYEELVGSENGTSTNSTNTVPAPPEEDTNFTDVNTTFIHRSFVRKPWVGPDGRGTEPRRRVERVHILAFNNFFHPLRSGKMNGTCAMLASAAATGYRTAILFGEGTKLRTRENGAKLYAQMQHALRLIADPLDFVLFVDLHDTVFTLPAHEMLDRYFGAPLGAPPFVVQGDHTMFGHAEHRRLYDGHYGRAAIEAGLRDATLFPFPNGGLFFARKKYFEQGIRHFFGHSAATLGIDMGWIAIKTVSEQLLQTGFVVIDAQGALSQNLNGGGIGKGDAGQRQLMPRNGRIFDRHPTCEQNTTIVRVKRHDKNSTKVKCAVGSGALAPRARVAPIWHFPGPSKYYMPATLALLRLPVPATRGAFVGETLGSSFTLLRVASDGEVRQSNAGELCRYHSLDFVQFEE